MSEHNDCGLCNVVVAPKDPDRITLRKVIELRGSAVPFSGDGPILHGHCYRLAAANRPETIRQLIANQTTTPAKQPPPSRLPAQA